MKLLRVKRKINLSVSWHGPRRGGGAPSQTCSVLTTNGPKGHMEEISRTHMRTGHIHGPETLVRLSRLKSTRGIIRAS